MKCKCCICAVFVAIIAAIVYLCKDNEYIKATVSDTASNIGDDISSAAGKVGKDIGNAAKDIGSELSDAAKELKEMMK